MTNVLYKFSLLGGFMFGVTAAITIVMMVCVVIAAILRSHRDAKKLKQLDKDFREWLDDNT